MFPTGSGLDMNIEDIMTCDVVTVNDKTTVRKLIKILSKHEITGVPVLDDNGALCGIVSEKDVIRAQLRSLYQSEQYDDLLDLFSPTYSIIEEQANGYNTRYKWVEQIMTRDVVTVRKGTSVEEVAMIMTKHHYHRIPVLDQNDAIAGIVTTIDMIGTLC